MVNNQTIEMHFYPSARSDGLVKRIEGNTKVISVDRLCTELQTINCFLLRTGH